MTDEEKIEQAAQDNQKTVSAEDDDHTRSFKHGIYWRDENPSPEVLALVEALKFECGNRCAEQNPCAAKDALAEWEKK